MKTELEIKQGIAEREKVKWVCGYALSAYGEEAQINVAIEEMAELIVELSKRKRTTNGTTNERIIDEIADVSLMVEQLKFLFGVEAVEQQEYKKILRLEARLKCKPTV